MKTTYIGIVMMALSLLSPTASHAQTLVNGLYYKFNTLTLEASIDPNINEEEEDADKTGYEDEVIVVPEEITYDNKTYKVTAINNNAFYGCRNLVSITLPNTIKHIGTFAFGACINLSDVTLPTSIKRIDYYTFLYCIALRSITIPEGVTTISQEAFAECQNLRSIFLPSTIKFIAPKAFDKDTALKSVTVRSPTPIAIYNNIFPVYGDLYVPKGSKEAYEKAAIWQNFNIIEYTPTTGIEDCQAPLTQKSSPIFTLSGQRASKTQSGRIYIQNGKKIIR